MKLVWLCLICLSLAICIEGGRKDCSGAEEENICKLAVSRIDQTAGNEKKKAKEELLECLQTLSPQLINELKRNQAYVITFADLAVTKTRKYWVNSNLEVERAFDGNQKLDIFARLVYEELRPAIEQGSSFPLADGANVANKRAAVEILRTACNIDKGCMPEFLDWTTVEANICGGDGNWRLSKVNTVHRIFVAALIENYTAEVLADPDQGLARIERASGIEELGKRWERITDILMKPDKWRGYGTKLEDICVDSDMPADPADRRVFRNLGMMAIQIGLMSAGDCSVSDGVITEDAFEAPDDIPQLGGGVHEVVPDENGGMIEHFDPASIFGTGGNVFEY